MIVLGIVFLCKKRVPYTNRRELRGPLVYLVCLMLIVPPLIFLGYGFKLGWEAAQNNQELDDDKLIELTLFIELPTYAGIALLSWLIVATNATKVRKRRRRVRDDSDDDYDDRRRRDRDYDDYDDRPRRRGRDDDDYDDRPRSRSRDDDDYDDRPRSRSRDDDYDYDDRDRRRRDDD